MYKVIIYIIKVGKLVYVGSTWNSYECICNHMSRYKNENNDSKLYNEIRNADLEWKDLEIKIINKIFIKKHSEIERRKIQQVYIDKYDSVKNGLNDINVYVCPIEKKKVALEKSKIYNKKNIDKYKSYQQNYRDKVKLKKEIDNIFKIWANYDSIL